MQLQMAACKKKNSITFIIYIPFPDYSFKLVQNPKNFQAVA